MEFIFDHNEIVRTPGRDWTSDEEENIPMTPGKDSPRPSKRPFVCAVPACDQAAFANERMQAKHFTTIHKPMVLMHRCQSCNVQSIHRRDVVRHMKKKHGGKAAIVSNSIRNKKYLSPGGFTLKKFTEKTVVKTEDRWTQ
jgi:hypothetical protein